VTEKQWQLTILALLSAFICGVAWAVDDVFATSIFAYLTGAIVLAFAAVRTFGDDAYGR
jgi:hypothetical protein